MVHSEGWTDVSSRYTQRGAQGRFGEVSGAGGAAGADGDESGGFGAPAGVVGIDRVLMVPDLPEGESEGQSSVVGVK